MANWLGELAQQAAGAFFGALFAFGAFLVTDHLTRMRERQRRHHTGLITLEYRLNEYLNVISDNLHLIQHFRPTVDKGAIHWSLPRPLPLGEPVYLDLLNLDVINEYFGLLVDLRKVNDDLQNMVVAYGRMVDLYASRQSPPEEYRTNALTLADGLETVGRSLEGKESQIRLLTARVRLLATKDSPSNHWLWWKTATAALTDAEVSNEVKTLEAEIEVTKQKSKAEIDRVLSKPEK